MHLHDLAAAVVPFALLAGLAAGVVTTTHHSAAEPAVAVQVTMQPIFNLPGVVISAKPRWSGTALATQDRTTEPERALPLHTSLRMPYFSFESRAASQMGI